MLVVDIGSQCNAAYHHETIWYLTGTVVVNIVCTAVGCWRFTTSVPITTKVVSLNTVHGEMYSIQHYVIKFVRDLRQVCGFLRVPQRYNWNIVESGVKHHKSNLNRYISYDTVDILTAWYFPLVFLFQTPLYYVVFQSLDYERTWWRLFQKRVVPHFDVNNLLFQLNLQFLWHYMDSVEMNNLWIVFIVMLKYV